jgi:hypothetical protein
MFLRFLEPYLEADNGNAGGTPPPAAPPAPSADAVIQALQARTGGSLENVAALLYGEGMKAQQEIARLQQALAAAQPAAGSVVLSADQAALWQTYQQLGAPDALKQQMQAAQAGLRLQQITEVATVAGYKPTVLAQLAGDLAVEVREVEVGGQKSKQAVVKVGDAVTPLADYATANWGDFLPSLTAQATPPTPAPVWPAQRPSGNTPPVDRLAAAAEAMQAQRDAKPNPLQPTTTPPAK